MPSTIRARVEGVRETYRALSRLGDGAERVLAGVITEAAEPIAREARKLAPRGPGPQNAKDNLPHVADTIYAMPGGHVAQIVSTHPAGGLIEYGGSISPNPHTAYRIIFPARAMAHRAADAHLDEFEARLEARIDAVARENGL